MVCNVCYVWYVYHVCNACNVCNCNAWYVCNVRNIGCDTGVSWVCHGLSMTNELLIGQLANANDMLNKHGSMTNRLLIGQSPKP